MLPLAPGSPPSVFGGARLAALWRRSRSARLAALRRRFPAALSLTPGSPLRCGALAPLGSPPSVFGGALAPARFAASVRRFPAAAKTLCATFGAALSLALGSPPSVFGGALAHARFAALRRFPAALPLRSVRRPRPCSKSCSKHRPRSFLSTGGFFRIISRAFGKKRVILF